MPEERLPTHTGVPHLRGLAAQNGTILTKSNHQYPSAGGHSTDGKPGLRDRKQDADEIANAASLPLAFLHSKCEESCSQHTRSPVEGSF